MKQQKKKKNALNRISKKIKEKCCNMKTANLTRKNSSVWMMMSGGATANLTICDVGKHSNTKKKTIY